MPLPFRRASRAAGSRQLLHELARSLTVIVDGEPLQQAIAAKLREVVGGGRVIVVLREAGGGYVPASARGVELARLAEVRFGPEERLVKWLKVNETPLVFATSPGVMAYCSEVERARLKATGATACFPLVAMNRLTGFVLFGPNEAQDGRMEEGTGGDRRESLGGAEPEVLRSLCSQAALALENAALLREQRTASTESSRGCSASRGRERCAWPRSISEPCSTSRWRWSRRGREPRASR